MKYMEFKGTKGDWSSSPQKGIPNHCFQAQVWGPDGKSLALIEPTEDENEASYNAKLISVAPKLFNKLRSIYYMSEEKGVKGCTWCDTKMSSTDVAHGYNLALEYIKEGLEELILEVTEL